MDMFRVDPLVIAKNHNINVIADPFLNVDGMIERTKDGEVNLTYNSSTHPNRQRFTIAHELGHFFLGHVDEPNTLFRDPLKNFSSDNYDMQEVEANRKAAEILMPKETLEHLAYDLGYTDIDTLANILEVSTAALHYRLKNLGMV